jgi:CubicO group peptidase (beta-lactamase class C family)
LFARAIHKNLISLSKIDASIDNFLDLPSNNYYPTIRCLMTHTSGHKFQEDYIILIPPRFTPFENPWYGVTGEMVLNSIQRINWNNRDSSFA